MKTDIRNRLKSIERILLVRLSAMGDCIAAVPVFHALRKRFPNAHIAWAIQDHFAPLIRTLPGLDEIVIFPRGRLRELSSWRRKAGVVYELSRHLRIRRFDLTVDVQSNTKSAAIAWLTRAPLRIGHGTGEAKELSRWLNNDCIPHLPEHTHIVQRNLHLLSPFGIPIQEPNFHLPPDPAASRIITQWLESESIERKRYVLAIPFTSHPKKDWPVENFVTLAKRLTEQGRSIVFLPPPKRREECERIVKDCVSEKAVLGPSTDLLQMVEMIRSAALVAGGDTGPAQIAGALGIPNVTLFGPTSSERLRPWNRCVVGRLSDTPEVILQYCDKQIVL